MSRTWQMIVLGVVISQGVALQAMDNTPNSPRRHPLGCSTEFKNEVVTIEALKRAAVERKNSGDFSKKNKEENNTSNVYFPWPGAQQVCEFHPRFSNPMDCMKPWYPGH